MTSQVSIVPNHLKHQPVFAVGYHDHDGKFAGDTDCQFLSVGWAQYAARDISAKTLRNPDNRWSRQSEELPLHRAIDLVAFIALVVAHHNETTITIPAGFFEHQKKPVVIARNDAPSDVTAFSSTLLQDKTLIRRLQKLAEVIDQLRDAGTIG